MLSLYLYQCCYLRSKFSYGCPCCCLVWLLLIAKKVVNNTQKKLFLNVDEYSCQTKCLLKVPNLVQTSYFSLEKPHCVICFRKKTLQVHNGWNFFLKDHPYFHATTFLSVANVFSVLDSILLLSKCLKIFQV